MSLKWNRPKFIEQRERRKPAAKEQKLVRIRLKWNSPCTGCEEMLKVGMVVSYEPATKARFCTRCTEKLGVTVSPWKHYRPPQIAGPHLVVENGQVRYVDEGKDGAAHEKA